MKLALPITSLALFSGVVLASSALTIGGLNFTADTVAKVAAAAPVKIAPLKPSYIARLPVAKADELNAAKTVPVNPTKQVEEQIAKLEVKATQAPFYTHRVSVDSANVRSGPKKSFPQVFSLKQGNWVRSGENIRGWVKVTDEKGREGWIYSDLLTAAPQAADAPSVATIN